MGKLIGLPSGVLFLSLFLGLSTPWFASAADPIDNTTSPIYPRKNTTLILIKDPIYGTRNVSYWVTDDKLAIIDGDVIYGSVDDLLSHSLPDPLAILKRTHSIRANTWPSATITYKFDSDATQTALGSIVSTAIDNWKKVAPYLKFTKVPLNSAVGQNGVVTIKAPACGGCNSPVGFVNAPMTMRLQVSCTSAPGKCGILEATHEFGHLLGLYHEHQRFDREKVVHYNCKNLDPNCPTGKTMPIGGTCCDSFIPAGCCADAGNFNILSGTSFDAAGAYDLHSIMQYEADAYAKTGTNTLTPAVPGIIIPTINLNIDSTDANRICKLYSAQCPLAFSCREAGCPTTCIPITRCNKPSLCDNPIIDPPPCCDPPDPGFCQSERDRCTAMGCNFLL